MDSHFKAGRWSFRSLPTQILQEFCDFFNVCLSSLEIQTHIGFIVYSFFKILLYFFFVWVCFSKGVFFV